jgi:hypothetical protein
MQVKLKYSVPTGRETGLSLTKIIWLTLLRELIVPYIENRIKTLCRQDAGFTNVKPGGICSYHYALKV